MHVEIVPLFRAGLGLSLEAMLLYFILNSVHIDVFIQFFHEIALRQDKHDRLHCFDVLNLNLPSIHVIERFLAVASYANHETVSAPVLHFSVDTKMLITTSVVDLDLELVLLDGLDATINVQYRWLVVLSKGIVKVVSNETRFTDRCVSN